MFEPLVTPNGSGEKLREKNFLMKFHENLPRLPLAEYRVSPAPNSQDWLN